MCCLRLQYWQERMHLHPSLSAPASFVIQFRKLQARGVRFASTGGETTSLRFPLEQTL